MTKAPFNPPRLRMKRGRVLVQWLDIERSAIIIAPNQDARGTTAKSTLPGTRDLEEMDQGRYRATAGKLVSIHPRDGEMLDLRPGGYVLYRQGAAVESMGMSDATHLAERFGSGSGWCFVLPVEDVLCELPDGEPKPGQLR